MAQIFQPSTNTIARFTIYGFAFLLAFLGWTCAAAEVSDYNTGQSIIRPQPVPFSHEHHVSGLGLDCRYCHTTVETSAFAGIPPTSTCYGCHKIIWSDSPMLAPVRESARTGVPLAWTRVNDLPDFVFFNHSIHIAKGVGCVTCHGEVHRMALTFQAAPLTMEWCLNCHRHPERYLRPKESIFDTELVAVSPEQSFRVAQENKVLDAFALTNCSTCHR